MPLKVEELQSYQEVLKYLGERGRNKHLLLGNGFSIAYDHTIFSYNKLYDFIEKLEDRTLSKLFAAINTRNFEQVMRQLDELIEIAVALDADSEFVTKLQLANELLRTSLIDAVKELHPEHVYEVDAERSKKCFAYIDEYLKNEGQVFTTNYDLLLYWVVMRNESKTAIDGFGREPLNPEAYKTGGTVHYSELLWGNHKKEQNIHYVHGALQLFDNGIDVLKEQYDGAHYILENIKQRMSDREYPIFVTAGDGDEKLKHIVHNRYLSFCYDKLASITGSLVTFGFNFGQYDEHIIEAINKASNYGMPHANKLLSVYIGVYSDEDAAHIESIKNKFRCKVNLYNARTAGVWD